MDETVLATKADLAQMTQDVLREMQKMYNKLYEADDQILTVLGNMDKRLTKKVENHEERLVVIEKTLAA